MSGVRDAMLAMHAHVFVFSGDGPGDVQGGVGEGERLAGVTKL